MLIVAALFAAPASSQPSYSKPQVDRTPATCDKYDLVHHRHRARASLKAAYESDPPERAKIRAAQRHKRCVEVEKVRAQIEALRERLKDRVAEEKSGGSWCAPNPAPDGGGCWVIPEWCVQAESGGSWTADNPSSDARGPYQLLGHGEPWPVVTRAQAMEHHRIAADLYASQGLGPWVAC